MLIHQDAEFSIVFGDARDSFVPYEWYETTAETLLDYKPFLNIKKYISLTQLVVLHQVHSAHGLSINSIEQAKKIKPFSIDGDFLSTNCAMVGLGVVTADCLPVVIYDSFSVAVAIVHAGWRGTINSIIINALERMQQQYGTKLEHVRIFFGPCAKVCCYTVGEDFIKNVEHFPFAQNVVYRRGERYVFDLLLCNRLQLEHFGVRKEAINIKYALCTICNESFCSYRRTKGPVRQMTVVGLR